MGLDIRILANKKGHEEKHIGAWKDNWVLLSNLEYLADPIIESGKQEVNAIYMPLTTENLFDLEYDLKRCIVDTYPKPKHLEDINILEGYYGNESWKDSSLTKDSKSWKWLHRARYMIENGWNVSIWWWY